jgi:RNA polymerase sigma-70 factor, ECF subfamily
MLRDAVGGSDEALATLVRTYHDRVYRFGRGVCRDHFDADDAVQEAFIKLARRPDVQSDQGVLSWLMSVVRNTCLRMLRRFARSQPLLAERSLVRDESTPSPEVLLDRFQLVQEVHRAIASLPLEYRKVLILRDLEGLPGEEVAHMLHLTEAAMKTRLHRARHMLRERLLTSHTG